MPTNLADKVNSCKVQVVCSSLLQYGITEDAIWLQGWVCDKLRGAPQEGKELVVIQAPDAMRASRL